MSDLTLQFPKDIAEEIGLHENEINSFKGKGCRFYGRKTCVAWVREYLTRITAGPDELAPGAHPPRSAVNKSGAPASKNDSPAASLATH